MNFVFEDLQENRNLVVGDNQNRAGCNRLTTAPFFNFIRCLSEFNEEYRDKSEIFSVEDRPDKYIISVGTHNDPQNWAGGELSVHEDYHSVFENISEEYITDLRNGKALLLFDNSLEGFHEEWLFEYLHYECDKYSINPNQIVYVTGNLTVEEQYELWLQKYPKKKRINPLPYPCFQTDIFLFSRILPEANNTYPPTFDEQLEYKKNNLDKIKLFSFLNKKPRIHRVHLYKLLYIHGLLNKGLVSMENFGTHDNDFGGNHNSEFCGFEISDELNKQIFETLPRRIYDRSNEEFNPDYYVTRFHPEVALDSWLQVISETYFYDNYETLFLSEKTFKVIASSQPFIVFGNKGSLKQLRKLGYKTFSDFFDESYDELDDCDRIKAIIKLLNDIDKIENKLEWFKSMEDVLVHNKNLIKHNSVNDTPYVYKKVKEIYETVLK